MTAEEFRSSQLSHLSRNARRARRLLYPGLSEVLKAQLGVGSKGTKTTTAELAARTKSSPPDGHVRRYGTVVPPGGIRCGALSAEHVDKARNAARSSSKDTLDYTSDMWFDRIMSKLSGKCAHHERATNGACASRCRTAMYDGLNLWHQNIAVFSMYIEHHTSQACSRST